MKKFLSIFLILLMVISLSACASTQNEKPGESDTPPVDDSNKDNDDADIEDDKDKEDEEEAKKEKEVDLYFANQKYVETGDESLEKLKSEKRTVNYEDTTLEEAVVREVLKGPEDKENLTSPIPDNINLLEVKVMDDTAYVDFSSENLTGGSMQESFTINQIVESLLGLDTVKKVQFLVDGKEADSLMGHVSIDKPFTFSE
ncbi:GerMN domain-containing protein [Tissierella creatinophila]|uniref:Sporulation and spore germination n=1 Tax=Tissierella creatinophila DSM 6911 TaxID=1123403 RepID=A0A1U7M8M1_TISCR|nr:GerMN domain-containing protein [Tissierella creatinophila]OLS03647.1 sporulation and spore germination [Tissierella creatinophila DSM 6911]